MTTALTTPHNPYLDISAEVAQALAYGSPVVALESTIISHGMPYPDNVHTALKVEDAVRAGGASPATIAIVGGRLTVGLSPAQIETLGKTGRDAIKVSRRDMAMVVATQQTGATTVAST
ncbi:MAG: pseudouridine-5'-phosphate glycosidase, partial [Burkholderiaceae bacterium]